MVRTWFKNFFDDKAKFCLKVTFILMLIAHGFCFVNLMYSHDSLNFYDTAGLGKIGLGRFLYPVFLRLRFTATPWFIGVISSIYVALSALLITKIFDFNRIQSTCLSILFSTNITLTTLFCTYIFDADADCFAIFIASAAVYLIWSRHLPKILKIVISGICLAMCLALYQAYICVAIGLFLLLLIDKAASCTNWQGILQCIKYGLMELASLLLSVIIYVPLMHCTTKIYGVELSMAYNGAGKLSSLTLKSIVYAIPGAYRYFVGSFFTTNPYNSTRVILLNWGIVLIILLSIGLFVVRHKKFEGSLVIIIPCIILLPLGLNAIYLVSMGTMHSLMVYAYNLIFLLPFILLKGINLEDKIKFVKLRKCLSGALALIIFILGINNSIYSNGAYTYKKLVYDNTTLHAQTIWKDINSVKGYKEGETKVVFMGSFESSKAAFKSPVVEKYAGVLVGTSNSSITYDGTAGLFYRGILGRDTNIVYNDQSLLKNNQYKKMPMYPSPGYCRMIGNRVIVKLSQ